MKKKGLTQTVATIWLILLSVVAVSLIWVMIAPYLQKQADIAHVKTLFLNEQISVHSAEVDGDQVRIIIKRGSTELIDYVLELNEGSSLSLTKPVDLFLVLDSSGSMVQSGGWKATTTIEPTYTFTIDIPQGVTTETPFLPSIPFTILGGVEELLVEVSWEDEIGGVPNEGYFYPALQRPDDTWLIVGASSDSDPFPGGSSGSIGFSNEYYNGPKTPNYGPAPSPPKSFHIENPSFGEWEIAVTPVSDSGAPLQAQTVMVRVYIGTDTEIERGPTYTYLGYSKMAASSFANQVLSSEEENNIGLIDFDTSSVVLQGLTDDYNLIDSSINGLVASGSTYMELGLEDATNEILMNGRSEEEVIRAILLLTDGVNSGGTALAITAADNAKNNGILLFTIGLSGNSDIETLEEMASGPGYFYYSPDGSALEGVYDNIFATVQNLQSASSVEVAPQFLQIVFSNGEETYSIIEQEVPGENIRRFYEYDLTGKIEDVEKISIHLGVQIQGKEILSDPLAVWTKKY